MAQATETKLGCAIHDEFDPECEACVVSNEEAE